MDNLDRSQFALIGQDDGSPRILLIPVETKESTIIRPIPQPDEPPVVPKKPEHEFIGPPVLPPFVGPPLPYPFVGPLKPEDFTKTGTVVPHKDGRQKGGSLDAPLAVGVVIMAWTLINLLMRRNRKAPVPVVPEADVHIKPAEQVEAEPSKEEPTPIEVKEEPAVAPAVGPAVQPENETVIIVTMNKGCCDADASSPPAFSGNPYRRAGQKFDVQGYTPQQSANDTLFALPGIPGPSSESLTDPENWLAETLRMLRPIDVDEGIPLDEKS